jgi:hypothetical protein
LGGNVELRADHAASPASCSDASRVSSTERPVVAKLLAKPILVKGTLPRWPSSPDPNDDDNDDESNKQAATSIKDIDARSQTWSIEGGSSLPSKSGVSEAAKKSTAVLDIRKHSLAKRLDTIASQDPPRAPTPRPISRHSSPALNADHTALQLGVTSPHPSGSGPSLAPSESISRVMKKAHDVVLMTQFSKYFSNSVSNRRHILDPAIDPPNNLSNIESEHMERVEPRASNYHSLAVSKHRLDDRIAVPMQQPDPEALAPDLPRLSESVDVLSAAHQRPQSAPVTTSSSPRASALVPTFFSASQPVPSHSHKLAAQPASSHWHSSASSLERALEEMTGPDPSLRYPLNMSQRRVSRHSRTLPDSPIDWEALGPEQPGIFEADYFGSMRRFSPGVQEEAEFYIGSCSDEGRLGTFDLPNPFLDSAMYDPAEVDFSDSDVLFDTEVPPEPFPLIINSQNCAWDDDIGEIPHYTITYDDIATTHSASSDPLSAISSSHFHIGQTAENEEFLADISYAQERPGPRRVAPRFAPRTTYHVEHDVARHLSGHWLPQTF